MRKTPVFSAKIWNGSRILRCMSAGCGMFDLRFRFRLGQRFGLGLEIGGGLRATLAVGVGVWLGFIYGLVGFGSCFRFVNRPDHVERALRVVFEFIAQDSFAAIERVF